MTSSAVRLATIITQSLAIAVAFTVLLGRIFVLSFYEDLGIPVSEAKLSAIDYSIFSPSVAVLGVGFAIIIGTLPLVAGQLTTKVVGHRVKLWVGSVLLVIGAIVYVIAIVLPQYLTPYSVLTGIGFVLSQAPLLYGSVMIGSGLASEPTGASISNISVEKEIKRLTEKRTILRWVLGFASIIVVLCIVSSSVLRSSKLGRDNAATTLQNAPQARVEFVSGNTLSTQHDFKVIMISDRFVYLLPEKEERPRESRVLHAFPVSSIARIDYISK